MKKLFMIFGGMILLSLFLFQNETQAAPQNNTIYNLTSITDIDYTATLQLMNATSVDLNDIFYEGQILKNYIIRCTIKNKDEYIFGELKWENSDYVIIKGSQNVNLIYQTDNKSYIFIMNIVGIDAPKIKYYCDISSDRIFDYKLGSDITKIFSIFTFHDSHSNEVHGQLTYEDCTNLSVGTNEITWTFTPTDNSYDIKTGTVKLNVLPMDIPSLPVKNLLLEKGMSYDINIKNKILSSEYFWSSTNTNIATVTSIGLVKGINNGTATIKCKVVLPDDTIINLSTTVTVGEYDENIPYLTDNILDLEIGNLVDINVENKTEKSTYKWSSTNRNVAKVTAYTGKVTALGIGTTDIICTITTSDLTIIILKCEVNVQ